MLIIERVDLVEVHLIGRMQVFHQLALCLKRKKDFNVDCQRSGQSTLANNALQ